MIEPQTYKEQDRDFTLKALKAVRHTILVLNEVYRDFWSRDPQQIVATMNSDVDLYRQRLHTNTMLGIALNNSAAAAGVGDRVNVTMPEGYRFNSDTNTFAYNNVVITPEPEAVVDSAAEEECVYDDSAEYFEMVDEIG